MKKIAMIPALLGSTRIADKNLLLIDGSPMLFYVVEACKEAGIFDEIYVNSEHDIFGQMANMLGVQFYRRNPERGGSSCTMQNKSVACHESRCQVHDHFLYDFMASMDPCIMVMAHTTSPLLTAHTIRDFTETLIEGDYDSLFSVEERNAETFFNGLPINFSKMQKSPTQNLTATQTVTWALSAWRTQEFMECYKRDSVDEEGPTFCGKSGVYLLNRIEALDADTPDELHMIEACLRYKRQGDKPGEFRFTEEVESIERPLEELIARDGVTKFESAGANVKLSNLKEIKDRMGPAPWIYVLRYTATQQIALICQRPNEGARKHCHVTHSEWWVILEGEFEWRLGDGSVIKAAQSDVVSLPRGMVHSIVCVSKEPGIRLACGARDMEHVYVK